MSAHPPPVPPDQRPTHGGSKPAERAEPERHTVGNPDEKGRAGNIKQNTTNQAFQQDR